MDLQNNTSQRLPSQVSDTSSLSHQMPKQIRPCRRSRSAACSQTIRREMMCHTTPSIRNCSPVSLVARAMISSHRNGFFWRSSAGVAHGGRSTNGVMDRKYARKISNRFCCSSGGTRNMDTSS